MLRRDLLGLLAAPFVRWRGLFLDVPGIHPAAESTNAAPLYAEAFRYLQRLRASHEPTLGKPLWSTLNLTDQEISWLLEEARPALDALRAAARFDACRWEPASITHEHLGQGRLDIRNGRAIDLLNLSATRYARAGDIRAMRSDLDAALTLAWRLGNDGVLIARVLGVHSEIRIWQTLGRIVPSLDHATTRDLVGWIDALPEPEPASAVVAPEARFVLESTRSALGEMGLVHDDDGWDRLLARPEDRLALIQTTRGEPALLLDHLDRAMSGYDELGRLLDLPRPEVWEALARFEAEHAAADPMTAGMVEPFRGARHMRDRLIAMRALARAGLILEGDGEAAFEGLVDPYSVDGAGFHRERRRRATLLRSALRDGDRPAVELFICAK